MVQAKEQKQREIQQLAKVTNQVQVRSRHLEVFFFNSRTVIEAHAYFLRCYVPSPFVTGDIVVAIDAVTV